MRSPLPSRPPCGTSKRIRGVESRSAENPGSHSEIQSFARLGSAARDRIDRRACKRQGVAERRLQDELDLAQSQLDLDKDELEEANQDLVEAAATHKTDRGPGAGTRRAGQSAGGYTRGRRGCHCSGGRGEARIVEPLPRLAPPEAETAANRRRGIECSPKSGETGRATCGAGDPPREHKGGISELAHHTKSAKTQAAAARSRCGRNTRTKTPPRSSTRPNGSQRIRSADFARSAHCDQRQLAGIYGQWAALLTQESHSLAHTLLFNALIVIAVLIAMLLLDGWLQHLFKNPKLDRRQVETLRSITRVA